MSAVENLGMKMVKRDKREVREMGWRKAVRKGPKSSRYMTKKEKKSKSKSERKKRKKEKKEKKEEINYREALLNLTSCWDM